jgi:succinyl-diaminopimelate desuccinylase
LIDNNFFHGVFAKLNHHANAITIRFIAQICPQVIEFGPPNATIHKVNEHVALSDIAPLKGVYRRTLEHLNTGLSA